MRLRFSRMVGAALLSITLLCCDGHAQSTAPASTSTAPAPTGASVAASFTIPQTLDMLQRRGDTLKDFTAKVRKQDTNTRADTDDIREGTVIYAKSAGVTRLGAHFAILKFPPEMMTPSSTLDEDLVFDGQYFIHRDSKARTFEKRALVPPGQVFDPLKLDVAPLPLPIGQDPADILRNFTVTMPPTAAKDIPPGYKPDDLVHLQLVPKVTGKYAFTTADLYVDPKFEIPVRVITLAADKTRSTVTFSDIRTNTGNVKPLDIPEPAANTGWVVTIEPFRGPPATAPSK